VRRHAEQEVERAARFAKHDLAGLDGGGLLAAQESDPRTLQARLERSAADLAEDRQAERQRAEDLDLGAHRARMQSLVQEQRELERGGRARVGDAKDPDRDSPARESVDRPPTTVDLALIVDVERVLAEPGDSVQIALGAESDDERVGFPSLSIDFCCSLFRMDGVDRSAQDLDAALGQPSQRPLAGAKRVRIEQCPVLPQAHDEGGSAVDQDDFVGRVEALTESDGGGDPAEIPAQDQDASIGGPPARTQLHDRCEAGRPRQMTGPY
jgi:hypothetical protein